ncbi:MAG: hypothetical protein LUG45_10855 [Clostridiales bacterium]|nr:hypothetical protein [Clostridiales bacterium]
MAVQTMEQLRDTDPRTVSRESLVERNSVCLNPDASHEERLLDYIRQIKNPYCYLDGGMIVKLSFQEKGPTIEERVNSVYLAGV